MRESAEKNIGMHFQMRKHLNTLGVLSASFFILSRLFNIRLYELR